MKGLNSIIYAAFAAAAVLGGCAKETISEQIPSAETGKYHIAFTAQKAEDEVLVKAGISADDNKVINWSVGDSISVFDGAGNNCKFILTEGAGTPKGRFEGEVTMLADSYTVLYPYQKDATIDAGTGTIKGVFLKGDQTAVKGSFDPEAGLMAARSGEGNTIAFRNIAGYVKFECGFDCKEVVISSNDYIDAIAGNVDIAFDNTSGVPALATDADYRTEVSLIGNIEKNTPYYIALLPCTLSKGFSLTFKGADGKQYARSTDKSLTVKRGVVTDLGVTNTGNVELQTPYITFSAKAAKTFTFAKGSYIEIDVNLFEYSVAGGVWTTMVADTPITFGGEHGNLRLRGKSDNGTSTGGNLSRSYNVQFGNDEVKVRCKGDIRTLIDYENYLTVNTGKSMFAYLFYKAVALESAPELPMTELAADCYVRMFYGTSIVNAPLLPATVLPDGCYSDMFRICYQLKFSPDLRATTVGNRAYDCMFDGCTALKKAPEIYAVEFIGTQNCANMFHGCSALEEGPSVLYAKVLTSNCYYNMFAQCGSLKKAPVIKAVEFAGGYSHCENMFNDCTSLEDVQDVLFAEDTQLGVSSCSEMFSNCTSLKRAPALPSIKLGTKCYYGMFSGCTSLTDVPESLPAMELYSYCYYEMFSGCIKLQKTPKLLAESLVSSCYGNMFKNCSSLTEVWLYARSNVTDGLGSSTFEGCPSTGVTAHIALSNVKRFFWQTGWTYLDIETGEAL